MQAVILAAGEGTRMRPLTLTTPKPMVTIAGKPLLDHIFEALPEEITEVVLVVRYLADQIKEHCGDEFYGRKITYAEGSVQGSAYSFLSTKPFVHEGRFLFIYGDEFPVREEVEECLKHEHSILCWEVDDPWNHGVVTLRSDGTIEEIVEKPSEPKSDLISNGIMVLSKEIFDYEPYEGKKGEYFLTSMVAQFVKDKKVVAVKSKRKLGGISTVADVERLNTLFSNQ